ncbi:MAG: hypothetical protein JNK14_00545 [Chitinophagaceae bacterium]|nr:hypothetical protein [Chitinophagaceae bacterium]
MASILKKLKITARCFLCVILITLWKPVNAQENGNQSEKYANAYKKYLSAACPIIKDSIQHFVYFAKDREAIIDHPFLQHPVFKGAQIMYSWRDFEFQKGKYDFTILKQDYEYLKKSGKKIFIQLQDVTFNPKYKAIPDYLLTDEYNGGATFQYNDAGKPEGWVAKRWNKKVRERFALLLRALGKEYDGKIEGINLQETAIGVSSKTDTSFSEQGYIQGLKENMLALKKSFPSSATMIYANFTPGEWLPWNDKGYLRSLYQYGEEIGVGLGGPDLMVTRKGQLNHALKFMHEGHYTVPLGIAVQDGNYFGKTGDEKDDAENKSRQNLVPLLHAFAKDFLRVRYMFWVNQEPYFKEDVLPCFSKHQ